MVPATVFQAQRQLGYLDRGSTTPGQRCHKSQGWTSGVGTTRPVSFPGTEPRLDPPLPPASCLSDHFLLFPYNLTRQLLSDHKRLFSIGFQVFPGTLFTLSQACQVRQSESHISQPLITSHSAWYTAGLKKYWQYWTKPWTQRLGTGVQPWLCEPISCGTLGRLLFPP